MLTITVDENNNITSSGDTTAFFSFILKVQLKLIDNKIVEAVTADDMSKESKNLQWQVIQAMLNNNKNMTSEDSFRW